MATIGGASFTVSHAATATVVAASITLAPPAAGTRTNRLVEVGLPGAVTVSDGYDSAGRMLWRKKSTDANPTTFGWNGMDIVRAIAPDSTVTRLYAVAAR